MERFYLVRSAGEFLAPFVLAYEPDQVSGRIYDTGLGYPAALFDRVGIIHGFRFRLRPCTATRCAVVTGRN